jgi:hypothetical protein
MAADRRHLGGFRNESARRRFLTAYDNAVAGGEGEPKNTDRAHPSRGVAGPAGAPRRRDSIR